MKKLFLSIAMVTSLCMMSCTDARFSKFTALGGKHSITLYGADGTVIETWVSSGKPHSEANSDGYYFCDVKSGKLIEVCGTIVIKQL